MLPEDSKDLLHNLPPSASHPELVPGRTYKIKNCATQTVLDLNDSDRQSIVGWKWSEGTNQMWTLSDASGGNWTLRNVRYSRKYLGLSGSVAPGIKLRAVEDSVHWSICSNGHAYMLSVPNNPGLSIYLSTKGSSVLLWPVDGYNTQLWEFTDVSHMVPEELKDLLYIPPLLASHPELVSGHTYKIENCATHTVLDLHDSDHQSILRWKWSEGTNQMWTLSDAGGGNWTLRNVRYSRKCLGLSGSAAPGIKLRAVDDSIHWSIHSKGHAYTLSVPNNLGLAIELNDSDVLLCLVDGYNTQLWEFTEVSHMLPEDSKDIPPPLTSQPELIPEGNYKIKNLVTHTVLDLNDSDHQSSELPTGPLLSKILPFPIQL
ncbi:ricin B lectin domain-containing protein [Mycena sanguinolenta]|nr:ricin B lectin domain-containing protein [Mycena sanguinolenta]